MSKKKIARAISIRQPYVELILKGLKQFEYRSMPTNLRERIYIYASLQQGGSPKDQKQSGKTFEELPKGLIVGSVEIVDCIINTKGNGYAYKLANPKRLRTHIKVTNQPSPRFWRPIF